MDISSLISLMAADVTHLTPWALSLLSVWILIAVHMSLIFHRLQIIVHERREPVFVSLQILTDSG